MYYLVIVNIVAGHFEEYGIIPQELMEHGLHLPVVQKSHIDF
jgi:hypothetical protein